MVRRCFESGSSSAEEEIRRARTWLLEFLERDGLGVLLDSLERLGARGVSSVADISSQIECVSCTRAVINDEVGLQYMVRHPAHTRQLATILSSQNTTVKLQVFELLCAICMFSPSGHALALDALQHFKHLQGHRYRFDAVLIELRTADSPVYQTTLLCFINCLILANLDLAQRVRIRNEFIGLGLGKLLNELRGSDSDALHIQLTVFDSAAHADHDAMEEATGDPIHMTHHQLFDALFAKVADTPQALALHSVLLNLNQLDPSNQNSDYVWVALEDLTSSIANGTVGKGALGSKKPRETNTIATQTTPRQQRATTFHSTGDHKINIDSLNDSRSNNKECSECKRRESERRENQVKKSTEVAPKEELASIPVPPLPPPLPAMTFPQPPLPSTTVPPPPPLPGISVPPAPPLPGIAVPPPPPLPGTALAPPSPGMASAPPPPPLPGLNDPSSIPPAPVMEPLCVSRTAHYLTFPSRRSLPPDMVDSLWSTNSGSKYNTFPHPRKKLKTLNWTKIPTQVIGGESVWTAVRSVEPRVQMDFNQIEELFCQKSAAPSEKKSLRPQSAPNTPVSPPVANLLDSKRSLAVNIFLKQFRSGSDGIVKAIKLGDSSLLGAERLHGLQRLLPDKAELELIKSHPVTAGPLGTAEQFLNSLAAIPSYPLRIEAMLQKEQFPLTLQELRPQLQTVIDTCDQVVNDSSLKEFFALILQFGNFLNAGSYAGNAAGFRLNTLPKLLDMRANKPRITFLHYVVEVAETQNKDVLRFTTDMKQMRNAARISLEALEDEVQALVQRIRNVEKMMQSADKDVQGQFAVFVSEAVKSTSELQALLSKAKDASRRLALHFCEDANGSSSSSATRFQLQECFKLFADFFDKVDQVRVENEQRRKQEERVAARRKAEETKSAAEVDSKGKKTFKSTNRGRKPRGRSVLESEEPCLVDLLMQEIRCGTFKLRRTVPIGQA